MCTEEGRLRTIGVALSLKVSNSRSWSKLEPADLRNGVRLVYHEGNRFEAARVDCGMSLSLARRNLSAFLASLMILGVAAQSRSLAQANRAPAPTRAELRRAPLAITLDARSVRVTAYAYLNLQPGPSSDAIPFHLVLHIVPSDSGSLPAGLDADRAWVTSGSRVWEDTLWAPQPDTNPRALLRVLGGGPAWVLRADSVDVVIRLVRAHQRGPLLRALRVRVERAS